MELVRQLDALTKIKIYNKYIHVYIYIYINYLELIAFEILTINHGVITYNYNNYN